MKNVISLVEKEVAASLQGAEVIGLISMGVDIQHGEGKDEYTEWTFFVAWERSDQCGTHRVQVNNSEESMCVSGHYDMTREKAIVDMLRRADMIRSDPKITNKAI